MQTVQQKTTSPIRGSHFFKGAAADPCQPTNGPGVVLCLPVPLQVVSDNPSLTGLIMLCSTNPWPAEGTQPAWHEHFLCTTVSAFRLTERGRGFYFSYRL